MLVELPVLTTGLDLEGDLVELTLLSVDLVRVGVVVALFVDSASFFLCNSPRKRDAFATGEHQGFRV